ALTQQLLALEPPREVRRALKQFAKRIEARAGQAREMPALLAELSSLQGKALAALDGEMPARPGLLQRLFGGASGEAREQTPPRPVEAEDDAEAPGTLDEPLPPAQAAPAEAAPAEVPGPTTPRPSEGAVAPAVVAPPAASGLDSLPLDARLITGGDGDPAFALPARPEPGHSAVAPHIAASLLGLLDELELPPHHQPQGEELRERIHGGLNWYELVPVLDDLGVLVLSVSDSGQREFAGYLKQLNERLAAFLGTLGEAHEGYSESVESARSVNRELREQVSGLQASVQEAAAPASPTR